jgi:endonuclease YncB( thermonuclease family)
MCAAAIGCKATPATNTDDTARLAMRRSVPVRVSDLQADLKAGTPPTGSPTADPQLLASAQDPDSADDSATEAAVVAVPMPIADDPALVLGTFPLDFSKKHPVIDGDTVRVTGLSSSLRLIGIDTEETFKNDKDREASERDFAAYTKAKRGTSKFPAKYATPMGEEAADWGRAWLAGVRDVRLEYDETRRTIDIYGRHLVYVLIQRGDQWYNYNIEAVRAGMTPYFMKYGYSARFHDAFVAAQAEAQAAKRGIWSGSYETYPDYPERLTWWTRRAEALRHFQATYAGQPDAFDISSDEDWARLKAAEGQVITVFGSLGDSRLDKGAPFIAYIPHNRTEKLGLVSFDLAALDALDLSQYESEYFYVRGKLSLYKGTPQLNVKDIQRVWKE